MSSSRPCPDVLYVAVSFAPEEADAASGQPSVRAFRIVGGEVFEVELRVVA